MDIEKLEVNVSSGSKLVESVNNSVDKLNDMPSSADISEAVNKTIKFKIIVAVGQSNMVGRYGPIDPSLDAQSDRVFQYGRANQNIIQAENPLPHWDGTANTVGPAISAAKRYLTDNPTITDNILIVAAADGGTGFSDDSWKVGDPQHEYAIEAVNNVMALHPNSEIIAFIWHQGERDYLQTRSYYSDNISRLVHSFRSRMRGASNVPFIAGLIPAWSTRYSADIAASITQMPNFIDGFSVVETDDLTDGGDSLHLDAASSRELGIRYATEITAQEHLPTIIRELDSAAHWILNEDSPTLFDPKSGKELTPANVNPSITPNFISLPAGQNGLVSDINDRNGQTICAVYKSSSTTNAMIAGTFTVATGVALSVGSSEVKNNIRGGENLTVSPHTVDGWTFTAASYGKVQEAVVARYAGTDKVRAALSGRSLASQPISIGNAYYDGAGFLNSVDFAEFIVFNKVLTNKELDLIYARTSERLINYDVEIA